MKPIRNILCYSQPQFDSIMENCGWIKTPDQGISCISICSPINEDSEHWFKNDYHSLGSDIEPQIFNLDIDDISPFWFEKNENECYDNALDLYRNNYTKLSNAYFNYLVKGYDNYIYHCMDYEEAFDLCSWIDWRIKEDTTIYIHCMVGASRSQGVVRYIVDTYGNDYDIKLNPDNPNNTYNPHVVMMLKRAYRELFMKDVDDSYFQTEPMKFDKNIKINLI